LQLVVESIPHIEWQLGRDGRQIKQYHVPIKSLTLLSLLLGIYPVGQNFFK
jgi:hypothetical protein